MYSLFDHSDIFRLNQVFNGTLLISDLPCSKFAYYANNKVFRHNLQIDNKHGPTYCMLIQNNLQMKTFQIPCEHALAILNNCTH